MKCSRIKDLILSNYSDGELKEEQNVQIREHLAECSNCRDYESILRSRIIEPMENSQQLEPSEAVWMGVEEAIRREKEAWFSSRAAYFLKRFFAVPKPVLAGVVAAVLIIVSFFVGRTYVYNRNAEVAGYIDEQVNFMLYLGNGDDLSGDWGFEITEEDLI